MSAGGRRNCLQDHYCFLCFFFFFGPPDERKNPDWSYLMNYLIHLYRVSREDWVPSTNSDPSDWSATCHSKPQWPSHIYIQQGG